MVHMGKWRSRLGSSASVRALSSGDVVLIDATIELLEIIASRIHLSPFNSKDFCINTIFRPSALINQLVVGVMVLLF